MTLNAEQLALLEWVTTPVAERAYRTHLQLAEHLGTTETTLYRWKKTAEFKEALALAAMEWGEMQLPKVINSLFHYAQTSAGDKDRMTIVRYFMPAVLKARGENQFDKLQPAGSKKQVSQELALSYLEDCSPEEQQKFMLILSAMGAIEGQAVAEQAEPYQVRLNEEDIIDIPQLSAGPGRPRGSRKVRLKRKSEDSE